MGSLPPPASATAPDQPSLPSLLAPRATSNVFPLSSRLATSSSPRVPAQDQSDFVAMSAQTEKKVLKSHNLDLLNLRLDWVERLCEPGVTVAILKEAGQVLDVINYNDLLQERHSLDLCPYPTCTSSPKETYRAEDDASLKLKMKSNELYEKTEKGNGKAFCSAVCSARSEWYKEFIARGGQGELLEEIEERRKGFSRGEEVEEVVKLKLPPLPVQGAAVDILIQGMSIKENPTPEPESIKPPKISDSFKDFERPPTTSIKSIPKIEEIIEEPISTIISSPSPRRRKPPNPNQPFQSLPTSNFSPTAALFSPPPVKLPLPYPIGVDPSTPAPIWLKNEEDENGSNPFAKIYEAEEDDESRRLMEEAMMVRQMIQDGEL